MIGREHEMSLADVSSPVDIVIPLLAYQCQALSHISSSINAGCPSHSQRHHHA
jgi:hypothetical protein